MAACSPSSGKAVKTGDRQSPENRAGELTAWTIQMDEALPRPDPSQGESLANALTSELRESFVDLVQHKRGVILDQLIQQAHHATGLPPMDHLPEGTYRDATSQDLRSTTWYDTFATMVHGAVYGESGDRIKTALDEQSRRSVADSLVRILNLDGERRVDSYYDDPPRITKTASGYDISVRARFDSSRPRTYNLGFWDNWRETMDVFSNLATHQPELQDLLLVNKASVSDYRGDFIWNRREDLGNGIAVIPRKHEVVIKIPPRIGDHLSEFIGAWRTPKPDE
jgi:hypothetical protein